MDEIDFAYLRDTLIKELRTTANNIKPVPTLGDDDSIYLTEYQIGLNAGLMVAISMVKRMLVV